MATQTLTITLPQTFADTIRKKVASGEFESEGDVVVSALMALESEEPPRNDAIVEAWLREQVVPIALRMEANPDEGYSTEEVLAVLYKDSEEQSDRDHVA